MKHLTPEMLAAKSPTELVDSALQVYARAGLYPDSRSMHEAAQEYRTELIRIVTGWRTRTITGAKQSQPIPLTVMALMFAFVDECRTMSHADRASAALTLAEEMRKLAGEETEAAMAQN